MRLSELLAPGEGQIFGGDVEIHGIEYDSRRLEEGGLFVAVPGFTMDGHEFIPDAIARGASAVMVETMQPNLDVPQILVKNCRQAMSQAARCFFGDPAARLRVIAVTGTNGKTTTTFLIKQGLESAGFRVALMGTIQNMIGDAVYPAARTTPEAIDIQRFLAQAVSEGCQYLVFEASSHGLALGRIDDVEVDVAVFTNLSQDHLDFHDSFEAYFEAKAQLFHQLNRHRSKPSKAAVINGDDPYGQRLMKFDLPNVYPYGIHEGSIQASQVCIHGSGVSYRLQSPTHEFAVDLPLAGMFNVYNSLAAAAVLIHEGFDTAAMERAMEALRPVPGRFELVQVGQPFPVVVDYAHTPDGLTNVMATARSVCSGRVIAVFGAGGDRDAAKRPLMAAAAGEFADYIIITSDNPRSEEPLAICGQVEQGLIAMGFRAYHVEPSRQVAIQQAVTMANADDIVVIAGKGHETYQEVSGKRSHFDDREVAGAALKELS